MCNTSKGDSKTEKPSHQRQISRHQRFSERVMCCCIRGHDFDLNGALFRQPALSRMGLWSTRMVSTHVNEGHTSLDSPLYRITCHTIEILPSNLTASHSSWSCNLTLPISAVSGVIAARNEVNPRRSSTISSVVNYCSHLIFLLS